MRESRSKTMSQLPYTGAVSCPVTPTPQSDAAAVSAGAKAAAATTKSRAIPRPRPPRLAVGEGGHIGLAAVRERSRPFWDVRNIADVALTASGNDVEPRLLGADAEKAEVPEEGRRYRAGSRGGQPFGRAGAPGAGRGRVETSRRLRIPRVPD